MWLVLDDSLTGVDPTDQNLRAALEQLLYAVSRSEHAIAAAPRVVRHLLAGEYSPVPKTVLRIALDRSPEFTARQKSEKYCVRVVAGGREVERLSEFEWSMPVEWIRQNGIPNSCILGENTRDAELFRHAAMHYKALNRTGLELTLDVRGGGGADTPIVLAAAIQSRRNFVLCITDSDKPCPCAAPNKTSAECAKISNHPKWVSVHVGLSEREVENALPLNMVADTVASIGPSDLDQRFESLQAAAAAHAQAWEYFDLKDGTPLKSMFTACYGFWSLLRDHPTCRNGSKNECIEAGACLSAGNEKCTCQIAPALGQKIVDHVLTYLANNSVHSVAKRASTSVNAGRWHEIGSLVCCWGAAMPKLRS